MFERVQRVKTYKDKEPSPVTHKEPSPVTQSPATHKCGSHRGLAEKHVKIDQKREEFFPWRCINDIRIKS